MKKIDMVDLRSQYLRLKPEIDTAIAEVLESSAFIKGPAVNAFCLELADYLGAPHVIACGNGTDALQVALMALNLQLGDEVITTNFTFISTLEVLLLLGLKPVLVDVNPLTFNIDPDKIREAITPKTRAIIPVHLFGQPADMQRIQEIAMAKGLFIIEDNAQSLGSQYTVADGVTQMTGTMGTIGTTSFFPTKPLACYGDGGALITANDDLAETMSRIINHGAKTKYYHDIVGVNSRLDTIQAAILRVNLRHLDEFIARRRKAAEYYNDRLGANPKISIPQSIQHGTHVYHQYTVLLDPVIREAVRLKLKEREIPSMVYYPVPLSLQKVNVHSGYREGDFPVSENLCQSVLSLPIHTEMSEDQLDYICTHLLNILSHE